ncbi:hypothetical protein B0H11DRAFT_2329685 [Mycena galericulata]|nr:hypothetical protein B0H11DRAFT_2329685 [Mycena galericulata]
MTTPFRASSAEQQVQTTLVFNNPSTTDTLPTTFGDPTSLAPVTQTQVVTATNFPLASGTSSSGDQNGGNSGLSAGAIAGLSLGIGLLVGLVAATIFFFYGRRRAPKNARAQAGGRDREALLGYHRHEEKHPGLYNPVPAPAPAPQPIPHARVADWVQRTRAVSTSTIAPSFFPTIADSETTVRRSQSIGGHSIGGVSSRSAYSQASAFPGESSEDGHPEFEGGPSRPPDLYKINE